MKRAILIATGTVGGLGAVLAITPPTFTSTENSMLALPGAAVDPVVAPSTASSVAAAPSAPTKPSSSIPRCSKLLVGILVPGHMTPGLFYFYKINKLIEQAIKKPVTNVQPTTGFDISWMGSKSMSTSNPTVVNVILDSM